MQIKNYSDIQKIYRAKQDTIEAMEADGYKLIETLFADASGFGDENEPALTQAQLNNAIKNLLDINGSLTAKITGVGQFQVYISFFKKTTKKYVKRYNNRNLAKAFSEGETSGKGSNLYIEGNTIYSYGRHFPLAIHTDISYKGKNIILMNSDGYSSSTQRHQSYVINAIDDTYYHVVHMPTNAMQAYNDYIKYNDNKYLTGDVRREITERFTRKIDEAEKKLSRARVDSWKEVHIRDIAGFKNELSIVKNVLIPLHPKHTI